MDITINGQYMGRYSPLILGDGLGASPSSIVPIEVFATLSPIPHVTLAALWMTLLYMALYIIGYIHTALLLGYICNCTL